MSHVVYLRNGVCSDATLLATVPSCTKANVNSRCECNAVGKNLTLPMSRCETNIWCATYATLWYCELIHTFPSGQYNPWRAGKMLPATKSYANQGGVGYVKTQTDFTKFITLTTCFGCCGPSSGHKSTKGRLYIVYKHRPAGNAGSK